MHVKTSVRKTKNGEVRYLQLAHNEWDAAARRSVPKIVYSFGPEDHLETEAIRGLVASLSRLLEPGRAGRRGLRRTRLHRVPALWRRVRAGSAVGPARGSARSWPGSPPPGGDDRGTPPRLSGCYSGLVANRALAPSSKLAAPEWMSRDVRIDGLGEVTDDACYRAMDWLYAVRGERRAGETGVLLDR
jgi:hypothetical protein